MEILGEQKNPCQWCGADIFAKRGQPMDLTYLFMEAAVSGKRVVFQHHCQAKAEAYSELVKAGLKV